VSTSAAAVTPNPAQGTQLPATLTRGQWILPHKKDPRWIFTAFLGGYVLVGHFALSFNRTFFEMGLAIAVCIVLDMAYTRAATGLWLFPLSAFISGLGLAILFTAPGVGWLMVLAAWLTITSKYLITWRGSHVFNPTNFALVALLLFSGGHVAVAPAYQWGGNMWMPLAVLVLGLYIMKRVGRLPMVLAFWAVYVAGALLRAQLTHMPTVITLWATVSGGAFMLFSFFMITDPKTSPGSTRGMILFGAGIGLVDIWLQLSTAVFSLFYALFIVTLARGLWLAFQEKRQLKPAQA
jgi:hypothetical protein